jgi:hypothetical protein
MLTEKQQGVLRGMVAGHAMLMVRQATNGTSHFRAWTSTAETSCSGSFLA